MCVFQIHLERKYLVDFILSGNGVDTEPIGVLSINVKTGEIQVHKKVDYEVHPLLEVRMT